MELFVQAIMESLNEGTVPLALLIMIIWSWDRPFQVTHLSSKWTSGAQSPPVITRLSHHNLQAAEAICSRMKFGKTVRRKSCPDDNDELPSFLFLEANSI
ncbi:hypothetical protein [Jeotgalibacillus proteolyticus]|uniref:Uncharacterized protein n=1 Tax=Jeotgalibacillus proteolyticus TaxID=2082395 RepID=A0A2S5GCG6_9BACL|nr:hypothetical protein [Jeotgalibacillus proteolyticus]PPA70593.1 hypothetical protein C4B60_07265 [Jeotgalibacillus proteolyticus]